MKYRLRHFENNFQIVASTGWIIVLLSVVFLFLKQQPGFLILTIIGLAMILGQSRGKRIIIDTEKRTIRKGLKTIDIKHPSELLMKEVRVSQNVNSRVSTTTVKMRFYKAYLVDGDEKVLISCNRSADRDLQKLKAIANDLGIEFSKLD